MPGQKVEAEAVRDAELTVSIPETADRRQHLKDHQEFRLTWLAG